MANRIGTMENLVKKQPLTDLTKTYKGKKVFLTGHTGFKGSWLLLWLHSMGAEVKGYALEPETPQDLFNLIKGEELCDSVIADIRDRSRLEQEIVKFQPDFIFHLAAQPLVRYSYEHPVETFETNVSGTVNLLDSVRRLEKPCQVIIITTDKVYHNLEKNYHYKETDKLGGYDPYSASKAAAEIVIGSYRNSFFNPANYSQHKKSIAVGRAGNVIGGGDRSKDRIIPDIVSALENKTEVVVRNPNAVRPWQHVLEPLFGYLVLGARLMEDPVTYADAWNFGPENDDSLDVRSLVKIAIDKWGEGSFITPPQKDAPHEAGLLQLDITKAKEKLQWIPRFSSEKAIAETIRWYRSAAPDFRGFTLSQINEYAGSK